MKFIFSAVHYILLVIAGHSFSLWFHRNLSSQVNVNYKCKKIFFKKRRKERSTVGSVLNISKYREFIAIKKHFGGD